VILYHNNVADGNLILEENLGFSQEKIKAASGLVLKKRGALSFALAIPGHPSFW